MEVDISHRNLISITKELEKQLLTFAETNSSILCHMEKLEDKAKKNGEKVDVWGKSSHFYYSIGTIKDEVYPEIVGGLGTGSEA